jgi:hypothetical protein
MALHTANKATSLNSKPMHLTQKQRLLVRPRAGPPHISSSTTTSSTTAHAASATAASAPAAQQAPQVLRKLQRQDRLRDPAKIGSRGSATVMVNDVGGPVSLATYMQLPVEQYYILDPSQIQLLSGNTFVLSVPKINLLGASLQPVITVEVTTEAGAVVLQATDCQLNATGIMGGLDEKFAMQFTTRLTWNSPQHQHLQFPPKVQEQQHQRELDLLAAEQQQLRAQQQQQAQVNGATAAPAGSTAGSTASSSIRAGWDRLRHGSWTGKSSSTAAQAPGSAGSITGSAVVDVWCEVIPPFNLMPREVLVGTCNTVISGLVNSLLPWFTRQLAADYQKWAQDAAYRAARAARSKPRQHNSSNN